MIFAILNTLVLSWECFGRLLWPDLTFTEFFFVLGLTESGLDPVAPFKAGDFFSHALGYIGGGLMIGTQLYRLRKWFGSTRVWMEAHIWMGVIGGIYAFFHTAFFFSDPIAIATFATAVLAIFTGTIGRYVLFLVPRSQAGTQLRLSEINERMLQLDQAIENEFADARVGHTAILRLSELASAEASDTSSPEDEAAVLRFWRRIWAMMKQRRKDKDAIRSLKDDFKGALRAGHNDES